MAELMQASKADLFWSDPPWGVNYSGKTREALTIENDEPDGLAELLTTAFPVAGELLRPATPFYLAAPTGPQGTVFRLALQAAGWLHRQSLAWVKNAHVLGHSDYHHRYEELLYGVTPGSGRSRGDRDRGSRWYGGRSQSDVFFVDRPARSTLHPTMKPVALIAAMLRNSSRRGEIVLDPFLGSGSTLIAAEQLGRVCYGAELDPRYVDVVLQRYEEYRDGA